MSIKKIKQFNDQIFLYNLKRVRDVMVRPGKTDDYFHITKKELMRAAERGTIRYIITDSIFVVKRDVMVIY